MSYTSSAGTHDAFYHYDDHDRLTKLGDWIDTTDGFQYGCDGWGLPLHLVGLASGTNAQAPDDGCRPLLNVRDRHTR